jgi:anti-anti-sigma factor
MTTLEQDELDGVLVLRVNGNLNQQGVDAVEGPFHAAARGPRAVVVDLSRVNVLNTPALAMFLASQRRLSEAGGRLVLAGTRGPVADLLRRCRLDTVLTMTPELGEAIETARGAGQTHR